MRIRFDGEQYFVSDDRLDLYGAGASIDEARADYALSVKEYYAGLLAHADRLARPLQEHLAYLRQALGQDPEGWPRSAPETVPRPTTVGGHGEA